LPQLYHLPATNLFPQFFPVPVSIDQPNQTIIVKEGVKVEVYCNATGIPDPTVIWTKVQGAHDGLDSTEGKQLSFSNITRAQAGEYRCIANNTCGEKSKMTNIDVQCKNI